MAHAHREERDDENEFHAEQLQRQKRVLSTIPTNTPKKRKNAKKDDSKKKKPKNSESQRLLTQKYREIQDEIALHMYQKEEETPKKKYEPRKKIPAVTNNDSMSLKEAMTLLDKHKTDKKGKQNEVSEKAVITDRKDKDGESQKILSTDNIPEKDENVKESKMHTRSSDGQETISETLHEVFEDTASIKNKTKRIVKQKTSKIVNKRKMQKMMRRRITVGKKN